MLLLLATAWALPAAPDDVDALAFDASVTRMRGVAAGLTEARWVLVKDEYVGGRMTGAEVIDVKYRAPMSLYMRWSGEAHGGRELLYVQGWNDDRLRVSPSPWLPTLDLDPDNPLVSRTSRRPITVVSMHNVVGLLLDDQALVVSHPEVVPDVKDLGRREEFGEAARCFALATPKDRLPQLYAYRTEVCFSERTGLPLRIRAWDMADGELRLVGDYAHTRLVVNPGFSPQEFTPEFPDYGF